MPVSDPIAARAGQHLRRFRRSHQGMDVIDYVISATAELSGAELVTLDVRHFSMMSRLTAPF
jgi:predicted nucleic acid-binding protein